MVKAIFEDISKAVANIDVKETAYAEKGYHLAIDANLTNIVAIVEFFKNKGFYITDL
jgi:hypothetical protein